MYCINFLDLQSHAMVVHLQGGVNGAELLLVLGQWPSGTKLWLGCYGFVSDKTWGKTWT